MPHTHTHWPLYTEAGHTIDSLSHTHTSCISHTHFHTIIIIIIIIILAYILLLLLRYYFNIGYYYWLFILLLFLIIISQLFFFFFFFSASDTAAVIALSLLVITSLLLLSLLCHYYDVHYYYIVFLSLFSLLLIIFHYYYYYFSLLAIDDYYAWLLLLNVNITLFMLDCHCCHYTWYFIFINIFATFIIVIDWAFTDLFLIFIYFCSVHILVTLLVIRWYTVHHCIEAHTLYIQTLLPLILPFSCLAIHCH